MKKDGLNPGSDNRNFNSTEMEKSKVHRVVEINEYIPHTVITRTILKKITGSVIVSSFAMGEELAEMISPFDTYVQIIDGAADLTINAKKYKLKLGEGIIIPAHTTQRFDASEPFKMITTIIKSGYED